MEFLAEYGLFFAKALTIVVAIGVIIGLLASASQASKGAAKGRIEVTNLNDRFEEMADTLKFSVLTDEQLKQQRKDDKKRDKEEAAKRKKAAKLGEPIETKKRIFVLNFDGDIKAAKADQLKEEITAVLSQAGPKDEVVVRLESGGGMVHSYGFASSQLARITAAGIPLTVAVDKVAASGGYMMACVADKILAAPFAVLGSIGVVAQLPNFHRLLKKNDIDFEMITAGEYKRTLTMFGENTERGREKFLRDIEDTHQLFKEFVSEQRPQVDIAKVATGEVWFGRRAVDVQLVDELITSDDYLWRESANADIYEVEFAHKKTFSEKLGLAAEQAADGVISRWWGRLQHGRFF